MRYSVSGIKNNTGSATGCIQREDSLNGNVHRRRVERFKHYLNKRKQENRQFMALKHEKFS